MKKITPGILVILGLHFVDECSEGNAVKDDIGNLASLLNQDDYKEPTVTASNESLDKEPRVVKKNLSLQIT